MKNGEKEINEMLKKKLEEKSVQVEYLILLKQSIYGAIIRIWAVSYVVFRILHL